MPLIIDTVERTADVVSSVNHLLALGGPRALSLRQIAATARVAPSSLVHHLGTREHILRNPGSSPRSRRSGCTSGPCWHASWTSSSTASGSTSSSP